jgi:hypothetical protein
MTNGFIADRSEHLPGAGEEVEHMISMISALTKSITGFSWYLNLT